MPKTLSTMSIPFLLLKQRCHNNVSKQILSQYACMGCAKQQLQFQKQYSRSASFETFKIVRDRKEQHYMNVSQPSKNFVGIFKKSGLFHRDLALKPNALSYLQSRWLSTSGVNYQNDSQDKSSNKSSNNKDDEDKKEEVPAVVRLTWAALVASVLFSYLYLTSRVGGGESEWLQYISWNEFYYEMLAKGEVEEVIVATDAEVAYIKLFPGAVVKGQKVKSNTFVMKITDARSFENKVRKSEEMLGIKPEKGIPISYTRQSPWIPIVLLVIVVGLLSFYVSALRKYVSQNMPNAMDMFGGVRKAKFIRADKTVTQAKGISFRDVAGLHEAKVEIMEFVDYLKKPERFKKLGAKIPKGALLTGPPGCGKTLLAKAVASEAKVPFLVMAGSEFVEMIGGLGAARVRDLFKEAREKAPCIIYIDEIDAIGKKRSGDNWGFSSEEEHTLNQLLVEMDGMGTVEGVILLGSTNRADVLDKALLRPGRFDRHISIDLPTLAERKETFEMYLSKMKIAKPATAYSERLAQLSPGMSGADIANICNEAALYAARNHKATIDTTDFDYAVERVIAGVAKKSRVLSPQEKKVVAYHEAGHALVGWMLRYTDTLLKVSIVPRTNAALGFAQYVPEDKKLHSKDELFEKMCMGLGGRVAESVTFNKVTSGAHDDLQRVTQMAYAQVRNLGMSDAVGHLSFNVDSKDDFANKPYSKKLSALIDMESRQLVTDAYKYTERVILENKEKLRVIAEALLEKEILDYQDMEQLIGPPPYRKEGLKPVKTTNEDLIT